MIEALIISLCVIATIAIYRRKPNDEPEEQQHTARFDAAVLSDDIEKLAAKMQEMKHVDEMIVDLKLCKPAEVHKYFRMEWMNSAGKNRTIDFMADGQNDTTKDILSMAVMRRAEINQEIADMICDIYDDAIRMAFDDSCRPENSPENEESGDEDDL